MRKGNLILTYTIVLNFVLALTLPSVAYAEGKSCGECTCESGTCTVIGYSPGEEPVCYFEEHYQEGGSPEENYLAQQQACSIAEDYCDIWVGGGSYCPTEPGGGGN